MKNKTKVLIIIIFTFLFYYMGGMMMGKHQYIVGFILTIVGADLHYLSIKKFLDLNLGVSWG